MRRALYAVTLPEAGRNVSGTLELLGKHIPLPEGEWRVASAGFGRVAGGARVPPWWHGRLDTR